MADPTKGRRASLRQAAEEHKTKKIQYENTYRMDPKVVFNADIATKVIREVMEHRLEGLTYDADTCLELAKSLSVDLKEHIKDLKYERYRLISIVTIGQIRDAEMINASRCLMSDGVDTFASYTFENKEAFAVGTVYAIYME